MQGNPSEGPGPSRQQEVRMEDAGSDSLSPEEDMSDGGGDDPQQKGLAVAGQPQMLTDMSLATDAPYLP